MSKIDEAKLNTAMKTIIECFQKIADATMNAHYELIKVFDPLVSSPEPIGTLPNFFPDPFADLLRTEDHGEFYEVYPIKFLGSDKFIHIVGIVQKLGGAYVKGDKAAGVKAHFTIPKEKGEGKP